MLANKIQKDISKLSPILQLEHFRYLELLINQK